MEFVVDSMTFEVEEEVSEEVKRDDIELVKLVQLNLILWNNSLAEYKNINKRNMMWETVGANLRNPLSGAAAQKKFANLRTVFGRIHKKVRASEPASGAAGNITPYIPTWPLYKEMLFLKDIVKPRMTSSNAHFTKPVGEPKKVKSRAVASSCSSSSSSSSSPTSVTVVKPFKTIDQASNSSTVITPGQITLSDFQKSLAMLAYPKEASSSAHGQRDDAQNKSCLGSRADGRRGSLEGDGTSQDSESDVESVNSDAESLRRRSSPLTPPADRFYTKRKADEALGAAAIKDVADSIRTLTTTVMKKHCSEATGTEPLQGRTLNADVEAFLQIIRSALRRIDQSLHLQCLQDIITHLRRYEDRSKQ